MGTDSVSQALNTQWGYSARRIKAKIFRVELVSPIVFMEPPPLQYRLPHSHSNPHSNHPPPQTSMARSLCHSLHSAFLVPRPWLKSCCVWECHPRLSLPKSHCPPNSESNPSSSQLSRFPAHLLPILCIPRAPFSPQRYS